MQHVGTIGSRIREHRKHAGLTQEQLAARVGTARRRVIAWETGENEPTYHYLRRVAEAVGSTAEELYGADQDDEEAALPSHGEMLEQLREAAARQAVLADMLLASVQERRS